MDNFGDSVSGGSTAATHADISGTAAVNTFAFRYEAGARVRSDIVAHQGNRTTHGLFGGARPCQPLVLLMDGPAGAPIRNAFPLLRFNYFGFTQSYIALRQLVRMEIQFSISCRLSSSAGKELAYARRSCCGLPALMRPLHFQKTAIHS